MAAVGWGRRNLKYVLHTDVPENSYERTWRLPPKVMMSDNLSESNCIQMPSKGAQAQTNDMQEVFGSTQLTPH